MRDWLVVQCATLGAEIIITKTPEQQCLPEFDHLIKEEYNCERIHPSRIYNSMKSTHLGERRGHSYIHEEIN